MEWSIQQLLMSNFSVGRLQKSERVGPDKLFEIERGFSRQLYDIA